ncbi:potassium channel-like protein [Dendryphion nanum]|uniref:Potassium channel-like protein n=1 Tax=Dendryphion nanum TaxID=256645 RepID=A0A9P9E0Y9_9PLEO|nr:potassium channel-like protein [Dendryphion nanum]
MASIPSTSTENQDKPVTPADDATRDHVQYQHHDTLPSDLPGVPLNRKKSTLKIWKKFRDGQETKWWFASTAIPLLAATLGPLANVLSIAALVSYWREDVFFDGKIVLDFQGIAFPDPRWCYWLNVASLIAGFLGNLFLLLNFTQRIRYIIALPATIIFWYISTGLLISITGSMEVYSPPLRPYQTYTQGFWYAIAAAAFYLICSMILMVNMLGHYLGHYPATFALTDAQRTLILQTMLFVIWLAGGAGVFSKIENDAGQDGWDFANALYFCDVTILTVGFGDLYPTTNVGRGIVFPYSVGGIIMLGLVISSIYKFMKQLGEENIIKKHIERMRERTVERTVTSSFDLRQREHDAHHLIRKRSIVRKEGISAPSEGRAYHTAMGNSVRRVKTMTPNVPHALRLRQRKPRLLLLREEKDRFDAMRRIQHDTKNFKKWWALSLSVSAFAILWCVGAVVFWQAEKVAQGMTYFEALYFCYISLLTIGYGDLAPKSNAGRCFFVVWSLIAVPTMTILVSDLGDTVVMKFKVWSDHLADFTVLPQSGVWRIFLDKHPWLLNWIQTRVASRAAKKRLQRGFDTTDPDATRPSDDVLALDGQGAPDDLEDPELAAITFPTIPALAQEAETDAVGKPPTPHALAHRLALAIRCVAADIRLTVPKQYCYEEWVEFTRLIRFSSSSAGEGGEGVMDEEDEEGLVEWDWIGHNSPLVSGVCESEWLLQRLCESLVRVERREEAACRRDDLEKRRIFYAGKEREKKKYERSENEDQMSGGVSMGN